MYIIYVSFISNIYVYTHINIYIQFYQIWDFVSTIIMMLNKSLPAFISTTSLFSPACTKLLWKMTCLTFLKLFLIWMLYSAIFYGCLSFFLLELFSGDSQMLLLHESNWFLSFAVQILLISWYQNLIISWLLGKHFVLYIKLLKIILEDHVYILFCANLRFLLSGMHTSENGPACTLCWMDLQGIARIFQIWLYHFNLQ